MKSKVTTSQPTLPPISTLFPYTTLFRSLIHESIYDDFMARALPRVEAIKRGHPLDPDTMVGAQASSDQFEKIKSYLDIGRQEGAEVLAGGEEIGRAHV